METIISLLHGSGVNDRRDLRARCQSEQPLADTKILGKIKSLAEGRETWAVPWPCIYEFFSVVTHPKIWEGCGIFAG